jgi:cytoskeleton protein RodZ
MALFQRIKSSHAGDGPEPERRAPPKLLSAGETLRQQRQAFGLEIDQVSSGLKIKPAYLVAIEEGRTDLLPGAAYSVGFVRAYSTYLGLDSAEILGRFKFEASGFDAKPDLAFPMPLDERSMPGGGTVVTGLILAICACAAWYYWTDAQRSRPERVTEVPARLLPRDLRSSKSTVAPSLAPSASSHLADLAASAAAKSGGAPGRTPVAAEAPAMSESALVAAKGSAVAAGPPFPATSSSIPPTMPPIPPPNPTAAASPPASAVAPTSAGGTASPTQALAALSPSAEVQPGHVFGAVDGPSRILLHATAESWIQIRGADHSVMFTGLLKPGDTYRVPDQPGLTMRAGNAGGLDVVLDGKPTPSLGAMGSVRTVTLDPQSLIADESVHD